MLCCGRTLISVKITLRCNTDKVPANIRSVSQPWVKCVLCGSTVRNVRLWYRVEDRVRVMIRSGLDLGWYRLGLNVNRRSRTRRVSGASRAVRVMDRVRDRVRDRVGSGSVLGFGLVKVRVRDNILT